MNTYRTNSLPLASFLSCFTTIKFHGVDKADVNKIYFIFEPQEEAQRLADTYFERQAKVDPLELFKNYRALKDLVFETRRNLGSNI